MQFLRLLLFPFSLLYGTVMACRNFLYNKGLLRSVSFSIPVISVGNLTTGGTGKTPHIEYLIRLLKDKMKVATLSRGYGRKTKGFMLISNPSTAAMIGDEPMQYHHKFPDIIVSVGEERVAAIENLVHMEHRPEVILLDDAFQHRPVKPGLNILLIEFDSVLKKNYVMPSGTLREWKSGMKRADVIIITKSPDILLPIERTRIVSKLKLQSHRQLFFTYYKYDELIRLSHRHISMPVSTNYYFENRFTFLLVTGIANPSGLISYLRRRTDKLEIMTYPDHHQYSSNDVRNIEQNFRNITNSNKIIITTEKDAMRLLNPELEEQVEHLPVFYLPIRVAFHQADDVKFNQFILNYVRENKTDSVIH
jgi:tetraacyldisaccharide 4'-kinase